MVLVGVVPVGSCSRIGEGGGGVMGWLEKWDNPSSLLFLMCQTWYSSQTHYDFIVEKKQWIQHSNPLDTESGTIPLHCFSLCVKINSSQTHYDFIVDKKQWIQHSNPLDTETITLMIERVPNSTNDLIYPILLPSQTFAHVKKKHRWNFLLPS